MADRPAPGRCSDSKTESENCNTDHFNDIDQPSSQYSAQIIPEMIVIEKEIIMPQLIEKPTLIDLQIRLRRILDRKTGRHLRASF